MRELTDAEMAQNMQTMRAHLAQRIREARVESGLSQADLARLVMVPRQRISEYEVGLTTPSLATYMRLQHALGVAPLSIYQVPCRIPTGVRR